MNTSRNNEASSEFYTFDFHTKRKKKLFFISIRHGIKTNAQNPPLSRMFPILYPAVLKDWLSEYQF